MAFLKKPVKKAYIQYSREKNGFVLFTQSGNALPKRDSEHSNYHLAEKAAKELGCAHVMRVNHHE